MSKEHCKHGIIDQEKYRKIASKRKWTDIEYHVQDNDDVAQKYVKMYCHKNQLPSLPFGVPYPNTHGERGFIKHYHLSFDPKIGNGICAIIRIPCACVACKSIVYQTWISIIPLKTIRLPTCNRLYLLASSWIIKRLECQSPNTKINTF